jgi:hypothetical protein
MMFYEFRQYTIADGKRDEWVELMETVIIPFQVSKGMVVLGSFVDEENANVYYWIRRFKNEDERKQLYSAVYESAAWREEISPRIAPLLDRDSIIVKRIIPTSRSVVQ